MGAIVRALADARRGILKGAANLQGRIQEDKRAAAADGGVDNGGGHARSVVA